MSNAQHRLRLRLTALMLFVPVFLTGCSDHTMPLLDPKGVIGLHERSVILIAFGLMLLVVIPVIVMTFVFAWRYRASKNLQRYAPDWASSWKIELVVWLVPALIVTSLGILVWRSSHALSPNRPIASKNTPVQIEAVAMDWKWLFIYPKQHFATVNRIVFPVNTPVNFTLTSSTVMSSFFIPRLGGQIYAMAGMRTHLHLMANQPGRYTGLNSQFDGRGFSGMHFKAIATTRKRFMQWVENAKHAEQTLTPSSLKRLERPSVNNPVRYYAEVSPHLFDYIVHQFRPVYSHTSHRHLKGAS